ncbi:hypothetical protein AA0121_g3311 [Alternaria tenuissima]|nr:hypothetical protein AA0121_g3311 [Alternaria tenuissima]
MWMSMGLLDIVNLWSQQLEQVNKEVRIASCLPGLSDSDLTVLTWGFGNVVWYGGYCGLNCSILSSGAHGAATLFAT